MSHVQFEWGLGCPRSSSLYEISYSQRSGASRTYCLWGFSSFASKAQRKDFQTIGQRNGAIPPIWTADSAVIFKFMRLQQHGAYLVYAVSGSTLHIVGLAFIDDTDRFGGLSIGGAALDDRSTRFPTGGVHTLATRSPGHWWRYCTSNCQSLLVTLLFCVETWSG